MLPQCHSWPRAPKASVLGELSWAQAVPPPANINHCTAIPTCCFSTEAKVLGLVVFFPVLINIANQCKKNLPDLICQNTYGYRVKYVFLHFILDAESVLGETWGAVSLRILTQKMSSPFCSLWNWLRTAFPQKPRFLPYSRSLNPWTVWKLLLITHHISSLYLDTGRNWKRWNQGSFLLFSLFLSYLPKDKFCLVGLRGSTALSMQEKEGTKSTLIKYKQWVTNGAGVRNLNKLNKHWTTDHFINTIALPYCFSNHFFPFWFILCDRSLKTLVLTTTPFQKAFKMCFLLIIIGKSRLFS